MSTTADDQPNDIRSGSNGSNQTRDSAKDKVCDSSPCTSTKIFKAIGGQSADTYVSTSTIFNKNNIHDGQPPDIVLVSSDEVYFHAHSYVLHEASGNGFASMLAELNSTRVSTQISVINIPEIAQTLNIVLLTIYGKSSADFRPTLEVLLDAVDEFEKFGIDPKRFIQPNLPLFDLVRFHMPLQPLRVYSMAGHYDLFDLAVAASSHLLGYKLGSIPDDTCTYMGALYVRRLYDLHISRTEALKKVLVQPPEPHPSTPHCSMMDQTKVARAWALSTAYLIWDVRPGKRHMS